LKDLLGQNVYVWGPALLMIEDVRAEMDTNRNFRFTFTPGQQADRYGKTMARQWKTGKIKFEWKLVLPGKVVSSGLPDTQGNSTSLTLNSEKPETLEAAVKLIGAPLVITAEPAGLK